jgi:polyisoprenoid-binding protein YceI
MVATAPDTSDPVPQALEVRVDIGSLTVREGTGGLKPLTDKDRREIASTARKQLGADRYPEAIFTASRIVPGDAGGAIEGTLTLHGTTRPLRLEVTRTGPRRYRANTSIVQSAFGIKPYSAFLGALRLRDAVDVEADIDLSTTAASSALGHPCGAADNGAADNSAADHGAADNEVPLRK